MQHHGQDAPEGTELAAVSAGFDAQIELDVDGGGVGVGPVVARAQADPLLGFRFDQPLDAPTPIAEDGIDVPGDGGQEGPGYVGTVSVGVLFDGPDAAVLAVGEVVDGDGVARGDAVIFLRTRRCSGGMFGHDCKPGIFKVASRLPEGFRGGGGVQCSGRKRGDQLVALPRHRFGYVLTVLTLSLHIHICARDVPSVKT